MNSLEKRIMARVPEQLKLKHQKVVQTPFGKMENHSYVKPTELTDEERAEVGRLRKAKSAMSRQLHAAWPRLALACRVLERMSRRTTPLLGIR
jgi:hypothetical protein